jgi:Co/Zn/Cd efflux system component
MACCNDCTAPPPRDKRYRRVLWVALAINGGMFLAELVAGLAAGSVSLQADALDFLSDAANYGIRGACFFISGMLPIPE